MSNKPKKAKRLKLAPYQPTIGEVRHQNLVNRELNSRRWYGAYSSKHVGSKRMATLAANADRSTIDNI